MTGEYISYALLLKKLKEAFPDILPDDKSITLESFRVLQGQQDVVTFIEDLANQEEDEY